MQKAIYFFYLRDRGHYHVNKKGMKHKTCRIFLADDDEEDCMLLKEALDETKDAELLLAGDGLQLMNTLKKSEDLPNAIFLDLNMPRKNGHECLREIKSNERLQNIPVIIYSTSKSSAQIDAAYKNGANLYITKPDSFTKLKQLMKEVFALPYADYKPQPDRKKFVLAV